MCGIAGMWGADGLPVQSLGAMSAAIEHRGPDGFGYLVYGENMPLESLTNLDAANRVPRGAERVALAHRRLSIIDLDHRSDQPMVDEERGIALVYNGEVYNYIEVREELRGLGHRFVTDGDTEVVLRAYCQWGTRCVEHFEGMWAFALLDVEQQVLMLSRDRFGIKPLYYARIEGGWGFASEIKGLLPAGGLVTAPHPGVLGKYLTTGVTDDSDQTFFEGIRRVPAACNLIIEGGWDSEPQISKYWSLGPAAVPAQPVDGFRDLLKDSIRLHSRSDVPVGSCLSGGVDSSGIVCLAEELRSTGSIPNYGHKVFGYVPAESEFSEERFMVDVAVKAGADLTVITPDMGEVEEALQRIIVAQDEPFGSTSITAQYFVFQAARDAGIKVMLDGQGADEMLAGYQGYFPLVAAMLVKQGRPIAFARFALAHRRRFGTWPIAVSDVSARLKRSAVEAASRSDFAVRLYHWLAPRRGRRAPSEEPATAQDPLRGLFTQLTLDGADPAPPEAMIPETLDQLLWDSVTVLSLPALLRFEDRNSMAHSLEARVPFLDHRLVEYCFSLSDDQRLRGVQTKFVLRAALADVLPTSVSERKDKIGFRASRNVVWQVAERLRDQLDQNHTSWEKLWFEPGAITKMLDLGDRSDVSENLLWRLINAKLWLRLYWPAG